jgi:outer membrane protein OmpA-like peptidoglycan-associated protein
MIKIFLSIALVSLQCVVMGQSGTKRKADKSYESLAYSAAAAKYKSLADQGLATDEDYRRLADSYYKMGDLTSAEPWFAKLNSEGKLTSEEKFNYAQCLKWTGKEEDSVKIMNQFAQEMPNDLRAKEFKSSGDKMAKLKSETPFFSIATVGGNTSEADFGTCYKGGELIFASAGRSGKAVKRVHTWNNSPFLNLHSAKVDGNNLTEIKMLRKQINTKYHEGPACFTADGSTMYFTRNNYFQGRFGKDKNGVNNLKLFVSKLEDGEWSEEVSVPFNSDQYSVGHPSVTSDGKWLYFVSDMPGGMGGTDVWRATIGADGTLGAPENLGATVNTEGNEMFPFIHQNGTLFFASNGHLGFGGLDVFMSRGDKAGKFSKPQNLGAPLNSTSDDFAFIMNAEEKAGYVSSNRAGGMGSDDIYSFAVLKPLVPAYRIEGVVKDKQSNEILANTKVDLRDDKGVVILSTTSDENGAYAFDISPEMSYQLFSNRDSYYDTEKSISTKTLTPDKPIMKEDLFLDKDPKCVLNGLVLDKATGNPIEGARVQIKDKKTGKVVYDGSSLAKGDVNKDMPGMKFGDAYQYVVTVEKSGYLTKTMDLADVVKSSEIKFRSDLDKLAVGADLGEMIDINPIYFDKDKDAIRPDAASELDKIVEVMTKYPTLVIELGSHTDCRASKSYNEKLSDRRAKSSAAYIVSKGIDKKRISGRGYGEAQLVNDCACEGNKTSNCSEEQHQMNRRTVFKIVKM